MFVLGIDPGLSTTGYGLIEDLPAAPRAVVAGVIRTSKDRPVAERLGELHRDLTALIGEYGPTEAAIEQVFVNRNLQTASAVGRASGVSILALHQAGLDVAEYTPSEVKMALAGYGKADKEQVMKVVAMRLSLPEPPQPADAADALAIALCHLQAAPRRKLIGELT